MSCAFVRRVLPWARAGSWHSDGVNRVRNSFFGFALCAGVGAMAGVAGGCDDPEGSCGAYEDESAGAETAIVVRNGLDEAVLLPTSCGAEFLELVSNGLSGPVSCPESCGAVMDGACTEGCDGCGEGVFVRLEPEESHSYTWDGVLFEEIATPVACVDGIPCADRCHQVRLPRGAIGVSARAIRTSACEAAATDPARCTRCESDVAGGGCTVVVELSAVAPDMVATATFEPGSTEVAVEFQQNADSESS